MQKCENTPASESVCFALVIRYILSVIIETHNKSFFEEAASVSYYPGTKSIQKLTHLLNALFHTWENSCAIARPVLKETNCFLGAIQRTSVVSSFVWERKMLYNLANCSTEWKNIQSDEFVTRII